MRDLRTMSLTWPWIVLTAVAVILLIVAEQRSWRRMRAVAKMVASTGFVAIALFGGALDSAYGQAVLVALILSWWGDLFLLWSRRAVFLAGLVAFLLGHVAFGAAFAIRGIDGLVLAVTLAATGLRSVRCNNSGKPEKIVAAAFRPSL